MFSISFISFFFVAVMAFAICDARSWLPFGRRKRDAIQTTECIIQYQNGTTNSFTDVDKFIDHLSKEVNWDHIDVIGVARCIISINSISGHEIGEHSTHSNETSVREKRDTMAFEKCQVPSCLRKGGLFYDKLMKKLSQKGWSQDHINEIEKIVGEALPSTQMGGTPTPRIGGKYDFAECPLDKQKVKNIGDFKKHLEEVHGWFNVDNIQIMHLLDDKTPSNDQFHYIG